MITLATKTWKDCFRKDLNIIPDMIGVGFKPQFSYHDEKYKRTTPMSTPQYPVNFTKETGNRNSFVVWQVKGRWQTATVNGGGIYSNHKMYNTIEEVINL